LKWNPKQFVIQCVAMTNISVVVEFFAMIRKYDNQKVLLLGKLFF
jgi:hypothetical protein